MTTVLFQRPHAGDWVSSTDIPTGTHAGEPCCHFSPTYHFDSDASERGELALVPRPAGNPLSMVALEDGAMVVVPDDSGLSAPGLARLASKAREEGVVHDLSASVPGAALVAANYQDSDIQVGATLEKPDIMLRLPAEFVGDGSQLDAWHTERFPSGGKEGGYGSPAQSPYVKVIHLGIDARDNMIPHALRESERTGTMLFRATAGPGRFPEYQAPIPDSSQLSHRVGAWVDDSQGEPTYFCEERHDSIEARSTILERAARLVAGDRNPYQIVSAAAQDQIGGDHPKPFYADLDDDDFGPGPQLG